jgi:hypothetical protein
VVGKQYRVKVTSINRSSSNVSYRLEVRGPELAWNWTSAITQEVYFTAVGTTTYIELYALGGIGEWVEFDNASVTEGDADRSYYANPLELFGTIKKTPVATGADLVAYSGFTSSNYLQQPYNSDLSLGTGDFSIMGWVKTDNSADSGYRIFLSLMNPGGIQNDNNSIVIKHASSAGGGNLYAYLGDTDGSVGVDDNTSGITNQWTFFCLLRAGTTAQMWFNGNLNHSKTVAQTSKGSTSHRLTIGLAWNGNSAFEVASDTSVSLIRISKTAPSADQILKIYNDEKYLFRDNSRATIYGTSNAVTALAYDEDTNLLHVGTSSGRSVFSGLQRVDNTTTAVATSISAANVLVAEN